MSDPRLCVIGAGALSSRRIYSYVGLAGGQIVGACDLDREKAERNARRFGGTAYTNFEAMLDEQKPDGVIICIGPEQHAKLAPAVLRKGFPVYTEKPPAPTAAATLEVARVAKETGLLCMTAFKKRYAECYARAKEWIDSFPSEDLYSISLDYACAQQRHDSLRHSFLLDVAIHAIDLIAYLFGDAQQVFAFAKGLDAYAVSIRFAHGAVGSMNLNDGRSFKVPTEEVEISIRGGNFMTIHNSSVWRITEKEKPCEWREPTTFISSGDSGNDTGHLAELVEFVNAIREKRSTRSAIYESYKSMALYEAIKKSAETGEVVDVRYETL
ncbi:MAG: Gfo/Idh/MocA family oxidoreductase [Planctomycetota bacterium]